MNWILALGSAALLIACFPGYNLAWLAPVALAPLLIGAAREKSRWRRFGLGYVAGAAYWFVNCNWIQSTIATHGGMSGAAAWFVFVLFCAAKAVQTGLFALLAGWTIRGKLAVPATAALWVVIEYSHGPLGFAWLNLGNAGIDMSLALRIAPIAGVWGISFLFAAIGAEIANFAVGRRGIPLLGVALVPLLFLLPRVPDRRAGEERAVLVQPNIDEAKQWTPQSFAQLLKRLRDLSFLPSSPAGPRPGLLIWPEAPAPFYDNDPGFMEFTGNIARAGGMYLLAGVVAHAPDGANLNSAALIDPAGRIVTRYDKINLVPFGEFVPWPLGPIAFKVSSEAGDFRPGTRQVISPVDGHRLATFICYESVFPRFISRFVKSGAEVLFNPSNDGWFGKTAARYQHLEIVRMRAAENQRWILRATNDGITAAIDPAGRVRQSLDLYRETSAVMRFSYQKNLTLYAQWGDWLLIVCSLILAAGVVISLRERIHARDRRPRARKRAHSRNPD